MILWRGVFLVRVGLVDWLGSHYDSCYPGALMLCIAAKEDAIIRIGDDIVIYVTEVAGGQVRLSLSVPKAVPIQHVPPPVSAERAAATLVVRKASGR